MKYVKKVLFLKEISQGFSYNGEEVKGLAKIERLGSNIRLELSLINLAPLKDGEYFIIIGSPRKNAIYSVDESGFLGDVCGVDLEEPICLSLISKGLSVKCVLFGCSGDFEFSHSEMLNCFLEKKQILDKEESIEKDAIDDALNYFDETLATENYYENSDVDIKNLKVKDVEDNFNENNVRKNKQEKFQTETQTCTCEDEENFGLDCNKLEPTFFECVKEDVNTILSTYPEFKELERAIYGSKWVKIDLENGEYYFGETSLYNEKYLCYAVRGEKNNCPKELKGKACFVPCSSFTDDKGFFVLFQNEENGKIIK